ncbi:MAG: RNA ligase [Candidatus Anstonellales archaeon]
MAWYEDAVEEGKVIYEEEPLEHFRVEKPIHGYERGTVIAKDIVIEPYPHIKRIMALEKGVKRYFKKPFWVEEKVDGYNVRIVWVKNNFLALSRGGFVDWFAYDRVGQNILEIAKKEGMVCCEVTGRTPHTTSPKKEVHFSIFDIAKGKEMMPTGERVKVVEKYGAESVPIYGQFNPNNIEGLKKLMIKLDRMGKEGIVMKGEDRAKYVTASSSISQLAKSAKLFFDMPQNFYIQKLSRAYLFAKEMGLDADKYLSEGARSYFSGIKQVLENPGAAKETFSIEVSSEEVWNRIRKNIKEVKVVEKSREKTAKGFAITFDKLYTKTIKKVEQFKSGKGLID